MGHEPQVIGTELIDSRWFFEAHGEAVLDRYFSRGEYLDRSILCVNDRVAIGALRAAARHGLVPGRLAQGGLRIAGHDDYPLCPFTSPALTTVAQNVEAIGKASVSRLGRNDPRRRPGGMNRAFSCSTACLNCVNQPDCDRMLRCGKIGSKNILLDGRYISRYPLRM